MVLRIHWLLIPSKAIVFALMMIKNRSAAKIHHPPVQMMIINSNVDNAQNHSSFNDCSTVTWNVIRILNDICAHFVAKDLTIHSIWNDTPAHIPAFGHTNAIYAKNHSHNAVHSNHIVWKCMEFNISMHTKNVVQRYRIISLCLPFYAFWIDVNCSLNLQKKKASKKSIYRNTLELICLFCFLFVFFFFPPRATQCRCMYVKNAVTQQTSQKHIICTWKITIHIHRHYWNSTTSATSSSQTQRLPTTCWVNCRCLFITRSCCYCCSAANERRQSNFTCSGIYFFLHKNIRS